MIGAIASHYLTVTMETQPRSSRRLGYLATAAAVSILVAAAWVVFGVIENHELDATGGPITLGFSVVMAAISFVAVWFVAFLIWIAHVYRASRRVE